MSLEVETTSEEKDTTSCAPATATKAYRSALDTTPRKIVVHNVLKFLNNKQLDAIVKTWLDDAKKEGGFHLVIERYKKPPRNGWINVTVAEDCMVDPFIKLINEKKRVNKRGQVMFARRAGEESERRRNDSKKRTRDSKDDKNDFSESKRARPDVPVCPTPSQIRDKLTALWSKPYPAQLEDKKTDMIRNCSFKIIKEMKSKFRTIEREAKRNPDFCTKTNVFPWITAKPPIPVENVIRSPVVTKYRNKCELTFGYRVPEKNEVNANSNNTTVEATGEESDRDEDMSKIENEGSNGLASSTATPEKLGSPSRIPAIGFLPYGWRHSVARPHCLQNVPNEVCAIADRIDQFLLQSPFPPYDTNLHKGLWRSVTIRSSKRTKQVMVIIVHASPEGGAGEVESASEVKKEKRALFEKERDRLISALTQQDLITTKRNLPSVQMVKNGDLAKDEETVMEDPTAVEETSSIRVTSIFFQEYSGLSNPSVSHPVQHAYGTKFIEEKLGANIYQISPGAFFQVTTAGAEVLYNVVADRIKEVSESPEDTLMFDVCCGTGTIGLHCLSEGVVGRVIGVDISEPAIEDALANAKRNGFGEDNAKDKTRFVASRAELVMTKELRRIHDRKQSSIVAVVDPARDGLHPDVIKALRSTKEIQRLVYVSCNPTGSLVKDTALLCCPATKKYRGLPFKPTRAQPVDMFPLTPHCEMVMTFDRMSAEEVQESSENPVGKESQTTPSGEKHSEARTEEKDHESVVGNNGNEATEA